MITQRFFQFVIAPLVLNLAVSGDAKVVRGGRRVPPEIQHIVAVKDAGAGPHLTLTNDGEILAILHHQPNPQRQEGDVEYGAGRGGSTWEKRNVVTHHDPDTIRINHAAGWWYIRASK